MTPVPGASRELTCTHLSNDFCVNTSPRLAKIGRPFSAHCRKAGALPAHVGSPRRPRLFQRSDRGGHERDTSSPETVRGTPIAYPILLHTRLYLRHGPPFSHHRAAQLYPTVAHDGNLARIRRARDRAAAGSADLVVLPELALIGYPPEFVLRPSVVDAVTHRRSPVAETTIRLLSSPLRRGAKTAASTTPRSSSTGPTRGGSIPSTNYGSFDENRVSAWSHAGTSQFSGHCDGASVRRL